MAHLNALTLEAKQHRCGAAAGTPTAQSAKQDQIGLIPEKAITFRHFSVSFVSRAPNSVAVPTIGTPPKSLRRAFRRGCANPRLISRFNKSAISVGVSRGAPNPNHALA